MNSSLQLILTIISILFFAFIFVMVIRKKLELKYALVWLFASLSFIIISVFPSLIRMISELLHIIEPVNTLFLLIIFFLIIIVFTLTISLSRNTNRIKKLTQKLAMLEFELKNK